MTTKDFLSVEDVSRELGITPRTVRQLFHTGELKGRKVAGKYLITRERLKDYIDGKI